eukprot:scaffold181_cov216-Ochromonas_danica.AAC.3
MRGFFDEMRGAARAAAAHAAVVAAAAVVVPDEVEGDQEEDELFAAVEHPRSVILAPNLPRSLLCSRTISGKCGSAATAGSMNLNHK